VSEAARSQQVCRIAGAVAAIFALAATADPPAASAQGANVTASSAPAAAPAPATADASAVSEFTLANGLRVVVVPDHRVPVVTHMVWYAVGAADEGPDEHGVAHYLEHMMFKGTAAYPKGELDRFVTRRGGWHNATTSMDNTNYFQRLPKSALPQIMAMEADRMVNLKIDDADVASERAVVLEEYRRNEVSITMGIDKMIRAALYEGHPKARTTIGTESEIKALSGATAQRFYERFYGPNRATVVVAGDVTEAEVRALAEPTYGQVPARPGLAPRVVGAIPVAAVSQRIEASHERATAVRVSRIYLVTDGTAVSRRDANAASLFGYIAGGGMTSRMHRRLINEHMVSTSVGCGFSYLKQAGVFSCEAWGRVGVGAAELEKAFVAVLDDLAHGGATDEEFDEIKSRFLATAVYRKDNAHERATTYGSFLAEGRTIADVDSLEKDVASLSKADVERVGQAILRNSRSVTGVLTPRPATEAVARTLPVD
jgi:zinc protease